jgi:hypothetical protein
LAAPRVAPAAAPANPRGSLAQAPQPSPLRGLPPAPSVAPNISLPLSSLVAIDPRPTAPRREKLKAKFAAAGAGAAQIGGKGTVRRKRAATHKVAQVDDKKLQAVFKKLNVTPIPAMEEGA